MLMLRGNKNQQNIPSSNDNCRLNNLKWKRPKIQKCINTGFLNALLLAFMVLLMSQQPQLINSQSPTSNILSFVNKTAKTSTDHCVVQINYEKVVKEIGSVWISPQDACALHSCELNKLGEPQEVIRKDNCGDFYCDIDSEVRPKEGSCCGECVRTKCRFKDLVYNVGQTWHNVEDCTLNECVLLPNGQPMINTYKKSCPSLPKNCPLEQIYTENCCQYCNSTTGARNLYGNEDFNIETEDIWTEEYYSKHLCNRDCQTNEPPKKCFYTFVVEWYETLSKACYDCPNNVTDCQRPHCITGDGIARSITVVNRMMPGPTIEVCQNDMIVVDVKNHLLGESTTIHWHGMHMKENPYMDGVPHITQCPISPHSTFRYTFKAENSGTHFWHSHTGMQRGDGVFGALIIKKPKIQEPHGHLYDFDLTEHKMIVQDWVHVPGISMFASHHHSKGDNKPLNLLINGKGRYYKAIWESIKNEEQPQGRANIAKQIPSSTTTTTTTTTTSKPKPYTGLVYAAEDEMPSTTENLEKDVVFVHPLDDSNLSSMRIKQNEISRLARLAQSNQYRSDTQTPEKTTLLPVEKENLGETLDLNRTKRSTDPKIPLHMVPLQIYNVTRGFRYRFRVINAEFLNCPIKISIDNHTLTAFNSDGYDFEAVDVGSIVTYAGERFDFVVNADQPVGNYWIRLKGLMDCDERFTSAFQVAILHYEGAADTEPTEDLGYHHEPKGIELNAMNQGPGHVDSLTIAEVNALAHYDKVPGIDRDALKPVADYKFFVYYDFYRKDNPEFHPSQYYGVHANITKENKLFTPQLNHISLKFPSVALLPARDQVDDSMFCNETSLQQQGIDCRKEFCKCHHVLQVPLNSIVELIIIDEGFTFDANHPFHLHGNAFRVVGLERLGANVTVEMVKQLDRYNLLKRNLNRPPVKDTVTIPDGGYTIIRFEAHNPGFWLFHCHIEFHAEIGMALVLKVGDNDEMVPVPKNFPTCHDYMPDDNENTDSGEDNTNNASTSSPLEDGNNSATTTYNNVGFIGAISLTLYRLFRT
ncbi:multicopper oxidase 1 [Cochliomyia hominivorax]